MTDPTHRAQELEQRVKQLEELHTMQLCAVMTATVQNTEATRKDRITKGNEYYTQAYEDVCRAIDREMVLIEKVKQLEAVAKALEDRNSLQADFIIKLENAVGPNLSVQQALEGIIKLKSDYAKLEAEVKRLQEFHKEDMRVTNASADFHIKECNNLRQQLQAVTARLKEAEALLSKIPYQPGTLVLCGKARAFLSSATPKDETKGSQ